MKFNKEQELRSEFIEKIKKIQRQKSIKIGSIEKFKKRYNVK